MIYYKSETWVQLPKQMNLLANHVLDPITASHSSDPKHFEIDVGPSKYLSATCWKGHVFSRVCTVSVWTQENMYVSKEIRNALGHLRHCPHSAITAQSMPSNLPYKPSRKYSSIKEKLSDIRRKSSIEPKNCCHLDLNITTFRSFTSMYY